MQPFCDALSVSTPKENREALDQALSSIVAEAGFYSELVSDKLNLWRCEGDGLVRGQPMGQVYVVSGSGIALQRLREAGGYSEYLSTFAALPHRVTSLHATIEQHVDAPREVMRVFRKAKRGAIHLNRGLGKLSLAPALHWHPGNDGRDTGGVYLGPPRGEVRALVYDKRDERIKAGFADPGPLLRIELRVRSKVGACLQDAWVPSSLFYHYAAPDLVERPRGVEDWVRQDGGFKLPARTKLTPAELMLKLADTSPQVAQILDYARQCGPSGFPVLVAHLDKLHDASGARARQEWRRMWLPMPQ
jgi:hypothetical protein